MYDDSKPGKMKVKLKSLKKQLKSGSIEWGMFEERAIRHPQEINQRVFRQALQHLPFLPDKIVKTLLQEFKKMHSRNLVDLSLLRYACCYVPGMSAEMMVMLLNNVDHDDRTILDFFDVIVTGGGGHLSQRRYSVEALNELLKRSNRSDILHVMNSGPHKYEFSSLAKDEFLYISTCIVEKKPSLLACVDKCTRNIPLHHAVGSRSTDIINLFISEGLKVFPSHLRGGLMVKNSKGESPLQHLVHDRSDERSNLLVQLMTDSILTNDDVVTAELLHHALQKKNESVARLLIFKCPKSLTIVSAKGDLPIHIATKNKMCLEMVQLMIGEAIGLELDYGGLCIQNPLEEAGTSPIQNIVKSYNNDDVAELLEILLDTKLIEETNVIDKQLLPIALRAKSEDVAKLIIKKCPRSMGDNCCSGDLPLHIACRQKNSADLILTMIETGYSKGIQNRGGLVAFDKSGVTPLQILASNPSDAVNNLLRSLFDSDSDLLRVQDVIDFNLIRFSLCGLAAQNYHLFYEKLPDDLKTLTLKTVDKDGRSNTHLAVKNRHTNAVILNIVKENIRLCCTSGLFVKDNFDDMPIEILFRTHYPQWPQSYTLIEELVNTRVISQEDVVNYNLLHKVGRWPRCEIARRKAKLMLSRFPEALSVVDNNGDLPIHHITHHHRDWNSISLMTSIFVKAGIETGVGGSRSVGGLLLPSGSDGMSLLASSVLHEVEIFQSTKDLSCLNQMIDFFSKLLKPFPDSRLPFLQTVMNLMPPKSLPDLVAAFDDAALIKDEDGRSLLNISARKGLKWEDGLDGIFLANKPAVLEEDPVLRFPNFLLAAVDTENDTNAIFELLQNDSVRLVSLVDK